MRPTSEVVLRQPVKNESAKANLSGTHKAFMKGKKRPVPAVVFQQLSARGELRYARGKLLEIVDLVEEGDVQTLALEQSVRDCNVLRDTPPSSCRVAVLDLHRLGRHDLFNDSVITAALGELCHRVPGATTYPVLDAKVTLNFCKQLTKAIDADH